MAWWTRLKNKLEVWLISKGIAYAFDRLEAQHLGRRLNTMMDDQLGKRRSDPLQHHLALYLRQIAQELSGP